VKLSIVTINYNCSEETVNFLNCLKEQTDPDFDVIVIDNASQSEDTDRLDNLIGQIRDSFTHLIFVKNHENTGFSGGCNLGIARALQNGANWVLLLNPDISLQKTLLASIKAILSENQGVVGLALDEGQNMAYYGQIEWLRATLKHAHNPANYISKNFYIIGGAMLINSAVFEKIGFLDEAYFLYFEDADFSIRARRAGFNLGISPNIKIRHNVSSSTSKIGAPLLLRYHMRNALYFNHKNGPWYIGILLMPWSWFMMFKQYIKILLRINIEESRAILKGIDDYYKNRMGKIVIK